MNSNELDTIIGLLKGKSPLQNKGDDPNTLMGRTKQEYPILNKYDYGYKYNEGRAPFMLEHWDPSMQESIPGVGRPEEFAKGQRGIEVYDPKTTTKDVMGDIVSHHLVDEDPVIKQHYENFQKSITPYQEDKLQEQYSHAKTFENDQRSYQDWAKVTGMPAAFRGYAFKQWPDEFNNQFYTQDQKTDLDKMSNYLKGQ